MNETEHLLALQHPSIATCSPRQPPAPAPIPIPTEAVLPVSPVSSLPSARHAAANLPRDASQAHSCRRIVALVSRSPFASFTTVPTLDQPAPALLREREQREQRVLGVQPLYPGPAISAHLKGNQP